jgi:hypothetical protein
MKRDRSIDVSSMRMIDRAAREDRAFRDFNGYAGVGRRRRLGMGSGAGDVQRARATAISPACGAQPLTLLAIRSTHDT